jgi:hypothetical protein
LENLQITGCSSVDKESLAKRIELGLLCRHFEVGLSIIQGFSSMPLNYLRSRWRWALPYRILPLIAVLLFPLTLTRAQSENAPFMFQVVPYSAISPTGRFPNIYAYNGASTVELTNPSSTTPLFSPANFTTSSSTRSFAGLASSLNASFATALSVIPLASPASGVIVKYDPATGADLPVNGTLGPIFTERGETIGKHRFYVGLSNQDFQFRSFNGQTLRPLSLLVSLASDTTNVTLKGIRLNSFPATADVTMNVRLDQNVAFLTYGLTSRFDVSVALTVVHSAVSANTYNVQIYQGNGFNNASGVNSAYGDGQGAGNCWCVGTFTAAVAPGSPTAPTGSGLSIANVNSDGLGKTGFGDMLLRFKGTVLEKRNVVVALGTDVRLPTGDERNFLGTGAAAVKPFAAVSLYTRPLKDSIVFSPHLNVGWQLAGKSILGGQLSPSLLSTSPEVFGAPLTATKDYLPDVFSWAVGTEIGVGRRNTVDVDILGNQIGWIHGIPNMTLQSISNVPAPSASTNTATNVNASGFVSAGRVSFGQYSGAFGYKARVIGTLVATFNVLVRFDNNGLTARATPLFGLGYTF